jgi:hypothetical protein
MGDKAYSGTRKRIPGRKVMPLKSGSSRKTVSENIRELHHGKTYSKTKGRHGKKKADKQAVAIALSTARGGKRKKRSRSSGR